MKSLLLLVGCVFSTVTFAEGDWQHYVEQSADGGSPTPIERIAKHVIDDCRPDTMGDVHGFTSQNGPGKPYNIHVYCKSGQGKTKVRGLAVKISSQDDFTNSLKNYKAFSIIGFYNGTTAGFDIVFVLEGSQ